MIDEYSDYLRSKGRYWAQSPEGLSLCFGSWSSYPNRFRVHVHPEPRPVVRLIAEALGLGCQVRGLVGWNTALVDMDGHPFLEGLDVRDEAGSAVWVRLMMPSQSGSLIPSTISRFCASLMPAEYSP